MSVSKKFTNSAAIGLLSVAAALAGCNQTPSTAEEAAAEKAEASIGMGKCLVVDKNTGRGRRLDAYDYNLNVIVLKVNLNGEIYTDSVAVPMKDISEDAQARAKELFKLLPPSANCKLPKFN